MSFGNPQIKSSAGSSTIPTPPGPSPAPPPAPEILVPYSASGMDDSNAIQAILSGGGSPLLVSSAGPAGELYTVTKPIVLPYAINGQKIQGAGAGLSATAACTALQYTGTGNLFTLGGGTSGNFTRWQGIQDLEIIGNALAGSAIYMQSTRWCYVVRCNIHGFTAAGNATILLDGSNALQYPNYFALIQDCWFDTGVFGVYLRGDTAGAGANSNVILRNTFTNFTNYCVVVDGGATNRIQDNEFSTTTGGGVQVTSANHVALYNEVKGNAFDGNAGTGVLNTGTGTKLIGNTGPNYTLNDTGVNTTRFEAGGVEAAGGIQPGIPGGGTQTGAIYQGSGVPSNANGNNGDTYFRTDTPGTANQRVYVKSAGTWVGIL